MMEQYLLKLSDEYGKIMAGGLRNFVFMRGSDGEYDFAAAFADSGDARDYIDYLSTVGRDAEFLDLSSLFPDS